eukprot:TRINITY_DN11410_c0_g2_i1.p2 TRINITY_DN11410_c0_g2~~TRINITY_DN11410_c0_g2_i1.p2  ORF type:complete len:242 (-),score=57.37 TRINITY_DN11410_c0_g2_i1:157-882(-)
MVSGGQADYQLVAVLDIDSMAELPAAPANGVSRGGGEASAAAASGQTLMQTVTVPPGALPGQQIEAESILDGSPMVVMVPPGKMPGDTFCVNPPGALSSMAESDDVDVSELQLALRLSMGEDASAAADAGADGAGARGGGNGAGAHGVQRARRRGRHVKPLSLIWACGEFADLYHEGNTVIVDDTVDVCRANPKHSIQCTRYYWKDHNTDVELGRLGQYLATIAAAPSFPQSHTLWRDGLC